MLQENPATILLAEDEPSVRNMIATILRGHGYHVLEATDGQNALEVANQQEEISLLLSDIVMPNLTGLELVKQFKVVFPEAKVILMSGYTADVTLTDIKSEHDTGFLSKPFLPQVLTQKIEEMLGEANQTPAKP